MRGGEPPADVPEASRYRVKAGARSAAFVVSLTAFQTDGATTAVVGLVRAIAKEKLRDAEIERRAAAARAKEEEGKRKEMERVKEEGEARAFSERVAIVAAAAGGMEGPAVRAMCAEYGRNPDGSKREVSNTKDEV